jgi:cytochrome P450
MTDYRDVDYFNDLDLVQDPYPYFEYLRSMGPAVYLPKHNVVAVTGWEEGFAVLRDHELFSSVNSATGPLPPLPFEPEGDDIGEQIERHRPEMAFGAMLVAQDPPAHTRSRSLLSKLLTPRRFRENEEFLWRLADRQIDEFIERGRLEVVSELARPFAALAIADLLGVPEEDHKEFCNLFGPLPGQIGGDAPIANNPMVKVATHFFAYIEDRRRTPRQDVMTKLAQATYPDGGLPDIGEVVSLAAVLFGAGQDTTVRLMAAMFRMLGEDPELQAKVREDRESIPDFVEEVLRFEGPVKGDFRLAKRATRIGEVDLAPGTTVMLLFGAMNRDPRRFEAPNEFRLGRKNVRDHLAFGRGIHACPGAPLSRAEAKIILERSLDRISDIRIDETRHGTPGARRYDYEPNYTQRALRSVHLTFVAS